MPGKYDPLKRYLSELPIDKNDITLSFNKIEEIIDDKLPYSAFHHPAWWSNETHGSHVEAHAWLEAGWKVDPANQEQLWVRFIRQ